jgi:hypothetical protein
MFYYLLEAGLLVLSEWSVWGTPPHVAAFGGRRYPAASPKRDPQIFLRVYKKHKNDYI